MSLGSAPLPCSVRTELWRRRYSAAVFHDRPAAETERKWFGSTRNPGDDVVVAALTSEQRMGASGEYVAPAGRNRAIPRLAAWLARNCVPTRMRPRKPFLHGHEIADLKRRTQTLEREVARLRKGSIKSLAVPPSEDGPALRFRAEGFAQHRKRLGLSAREGRSALGRVIALCLEVGKRPSQAAR